MTEKSKVVPIRLSLEELETIQNFITNYKMKSMSDFVRASAALFLSFMKSIENLIASGNIKLVEDWQNSMRNELAKNEPEFKKFSEAFQLTEQIILPRIKKDFLEGGKAAKPFVKKRKAGRPKKQKRKRGDRKNRGYKK